MNSRLHMHSAKPGNRMLLLYLIDGSITLGVYLFAYAIAAYMLSLPLNPWRTLLELLTTAAVYTAVAILSRVNKIIWRHAGGHDYLYIFATAVFGGIFSAFILQFALDSAVPSIFDLFATMACASALLLSRIIYHEYALRSRRFRTPGDAKHLLIVGAGAVGARLLDEIKENPTCALTPVGFVDDNPVKFSRSIDGVRILGTVADIKEICAREAVSHIYIAIPSLSNERRAAILEQCLQTGCTVKILPFISEIPDSGRLINSVRDISMEELLGREPVEIINDDILSFVRDKTIVITGGGGSIGSEICRQIAANHPRRLVVIDIYENNAYAIEQELRSKYKDSLDLMVYIATVCDYAKIDHLLATERPDIVIHAAAHKHVPLMETVPDEAVKNNVFGTLNTVMAARKNNIGKFILISTDKAVNPTNIMGATKRICEMIIQYADSISTDTTFAAVRFGNVLGSNGSVIPLFQKQIESRRDVTVTDPQMTRYFMTIPEASQLVLTASAMAKGGEIFVLDMGKPVKIDDLARKMIALAGLTLGRDIHIRYIGLRPGEKLYEELLMSEEGLRKTPNQKIYIGSAIRMDYAVFRQQLEALETLVGEGSVSPAAVERRLMEIVPTFKRSPSPESTQPPQQEPARERAPEPAHG